MPKMLRLITTATIILTFSTVEGRAQDAPQSAAQAQPQQLPQRWPAGPGMMGPGRMMSPLFMRMMFALMDSDADGTVSLQEFQMAHERIFKAMDANKDGVLTLQEIQYFMRGAPAPSVPIPRPSGPAVPQ
jgi:hypothetical protein